MNKDARFYFVNLAVDVQRCVSALRNGRDERYRDSLGRAHATLSHLRSTGRWGAYEEGLLLLRALQHAQTDKLLDAFEAQVEALTEPFMKAASKPMVQ